MTWYRGIKKRFYLNFVIKLTVFLLFIIFANYFQDTLFSKDIANKINTIILAGIVINVIVVILFNYFGLTNWLIGINALFDTILISIGLLVTTGYETAFVFLYNISILSSSYLGGRFGATLSALLSTIFYGIIVYRSVSPENLHEGLINFFLNMWSFNSVAFFAILLVQHLKFTEENLRLSLNQIKVLEKIHDILTDSFEFGLIAVDTSNKIILINKPSNEILGIELYKHLGEDISNALRELVEPLENLKAKNTKGIKQEINYLHPIRGNRILGLSIFEIRDDLGKLIGYGIIIQDITEFRENELKLRHRDRMVAIGEMAAGLAHEIRNPLASITGTCQFIKEKTSLPLQEQKLIDIILRESKRLNNLVQQFLMYARPESHKKDYYNLREEIDYVLDLLSKRDFKHIPKILVDVDANLKYYGDSSQMKQILYNLLLNAYQSIDHDNGFIKITGRKEIIDNNIQNLLITIEDNGKGMDEDTKKKLFNPFFTTKPDGTGLGLAISQSIINSWGGEISFKSQLGQGSIFQIRLPLNNKTIGAQHERS